METFSVLSSSLPSHFQANLRKTLHDLSPGKNISRAKEVLTHQNLLGQSFIPVTPEIKMSLFYLFHPSERYLSRQLQGRVQVTQAVIFCSSGKLLSLLDHEKNLQETKLHCTRECENPSVPGKLACCSSKLLSQPAP